MFLRGFHSLSQLFWGNASSSGSHSGYLFCFRLNLNEKSGLTKGRLFVLFLSKYERKKKSGLREGKVDDKPSYSRNKMTLENKDKNFQEKKLM